MQVMMAAWWCDNVYGAVSVLDIVWQNLDWQSEIMILYG